MNEKQVYLCLLTFESISGREPFKFMDASIATSEEEAKQLAINQAWIESPEYLNVQPSEVWAYSFKRSAIEQAAREVLGWKAPSES